jgi:methylmalonyl-CoA mutase N-terminal domain/subunit
MNDPSPFTLLAFMLATAKRRGVDWPRSPARRTRATTLALRRQPHVLPPRAPGARRILVDHIRWCGAHVPRWNPLSVVGQHMQQAGATPAEAIGFTLASAVQYADDCVAAGCRPTTSCRASRSSSTSRSRSSRRSRSSAPAAASGQKLVRERYAARDPRSWRFKFHAQTSGVDLTRQQPLNNIARVTAQAIAGIFGGLQSLHTDAYDERCRARPSSARASRSRRRTSCARRRT